MASSPDTVVHHVNAELLQTARSVTITPANVLANLELADVNVTDACKDITIMDQVR